MSIGKACLRLMLLLAVALPAGAMLTACDDDDEPPYYGGWGYARDPRLAGVWVLADDIDYGYNPVFALSISADGTGVNGTWDLVYDLFYPEGYGWEWWTDGNILYMDDGRVTSEYYSISPDGMYANIAGYEYVRIR